MPDYRPPAGINLVLNWGLEAAYTSPSGVNLTLEFSPTTESKLLGVAVRRETVVGAHRIISHTSVRPAARPSQFQAGAHLVRLKTQWLYLQQGVHPQVRIPVHEVKNQREMISPPGRPPYEVKRDPYDPTRHIPRVMYGRQWAHPAGWDNFTSTQFIYQRGYGEMLVAYGVRDILAHPAHGLPGRWKRTGPVTREPVEVELKPDAENQPRYGVPTVGPRGSVRTLGDVGIHIKWLKAAEDHKIPPAEQREPATHWGRALVAGRGVVTVGDRTIYNYHPHRDGWFNPAAVLASMSPPSHLVPKPTVRAKVFPDQHVSPATREMTLMGEHFVARHTTRRTFPHGIYPPLVDHAWESEYRAPKQKYPGESLVHSTRYYDFTKSENQPSPEFDPPVTLHHHNVPAKDLKREEYEAAFPGGAAHIWAIDTVLGKRGSWRWHQQAAEAFTELSGRVTPAELWFHGVQLDFNRERERVQWAVLPKPGVQYLHRSIFPIGKDVLAVGRQYVGNVSQNIVPAGWESLAISSTKNVVDQQHRVVFVQGGSMTRWGLLIDLRPGAGRVFVRRWTREHEMGAAFVDQRIRYLHPQAAPGQATPGLHLVRNKAVRITVPGWDQNAGRYGRAYVAYGLFEVFVAGSANLGERVGTPSLRLWHLFVTGAGMRPQLRMDGTHRVKNRFGFVHAHGFAARSGVFGKARVEYRNRTLEVSGATGEFGKHFVSNYYRSVSIKPGIKTGGGAGHHTVWDPDPNVVPQAGYVHMRGVRSWADGSHFVRGANDIQVGEGPEYVPVVGGHDVSQRAPTLHPAGFAAGRWVVGPIEVKNRWTFIQLKEWKQPSSKVERPAYVKNLNAKVFLPPWNQGLVPLNFTRNKTTVENQHRHLYVLGTEVGRPGRAHQIVLGPAPLKPQSLDSLRIGEHVVTLWTQTAHMSGWNSQRVPGPVRVWNKAVRVELAPTETPRFPDMHRVKRREQLARHTGVGQTSEWGTHFVAYRERTLAVREWRETTRATKHDVRWNPWPILVPSHPRPVYETGEPRLRIDFKRIDVHQFGYRPENRVFGAHHVANRNRVVHPHGRRPNEQLSKHKLELSIRTVQPKPAREGEVWPESHRVAYRSQLIAPLSTYRLTFGRHLVYRVDDGRPWPQEIRLVDIEKDPPNNGLGFETLEMGRPSVGDNTVYVLVGIDPGMFGRTRIYGTMITPKWDRVADWFGRPWLTLHQDIVVKRGIDSQIRIGTPRLSPYYIYAPYGDALPPPGEPKGAPIGQAPHDVSAPGGHASAEFPWFGHHRVQGNIVHVSVRSLPRYAGTYVEGISKYHEVYLKDNRIEPESFVSSSTGYHRFLDTEQRVLFQEYSQHWGFESLRMGKPEVKEPEVVEEQDNTIRLGPWGRYPESSWDSFSPGLALIDHYHRTIYPKGARHAHVKVARRPRAGSNVWDYHMTEFDPYGLHWVSDSPRTVFPHGFDAHAESAKTWVSLGRRTVVPEGLVSLSLEDGNPYDWVAPMRVIKKALPPTLRMVYPGELPEPEVGDHVVGWRHRRIWPVSDEQTGSTVGRTAVVPVALPGVPHVITPDRVPVGRAGRPSFAPAIRPQQVVTTVFGQTVAVDLYGCYDRAIKVMPVLTAGVVPQPHVSGGA